VSVRAGMTHPLRAVYIWAVQACARHMSLELRSLEADALARELAALTGQDADTAVVRAIEERLARTPRRLPASQRAEIEARKRGVLELRRKRSVGALGESAGLTGPSPRSPPLSPPRFGS
jgi:hypothetical protein